MMSLMSVIFINLSLLQLTQSCFHKGCVAEHRTMTTMLFIATWDSPVVAIVTKH